MSYVSWAMLNEGASDASYFEVLLPRLMEEIVTREGTRHSDIPTTPAVRLGAGGRAVDAVANEACAARDAFEIVFIHADTGGRALQGDVGHRADSYCDRMYELCAWRLARCVTVTPRHETEAWLLADPEAVMAALGYRGNYRTVGLPGNARQAERLTDPKLTLTNAMRAIAGPRRRSQKVNQLFPAIALRQNFDILRGSESFRTLETKLKRCLADIGCIAAERC